MVGTFLEKLIEGTLDILQGSDNGDLTLPKSLERDLHHYSNISSSVVRAKATKSQFLSCNLKVFVIN